MTAAWIPPRLGEGLKDAELWNAVIAPSGRPIPLGEQGASFVLALAGPPAADAWVAAVGIEGETAPCYAHVADFPFRALFDVELSIQDIGALPDALRQALLDGVFATVQDMAGRGIGRRLALGAQGVAASFPELGRSELQWFAVSLRRQDGLAVELLLGCDRALAVRLLAGVRPYDAPVYEALAGKIPVPADMTLGSIELSLGELRALEPGDVAVLAEQPASALDIRAHDVLFRFERGEEGWRCTGAQAAARSRDRAARTGKPGGHPMTDGTEEAEGPAGEAVDLADLRIAVDFDIGRSMVPLSVLSQWQEGSVVDFQPPELADGVEVTIRANGDVIGSGDLVRIDHRVAVRITRLFLRR